MSEREQRAVRGRDIATLERKHDLRAADVQWLLGVTSPTYNHWSNGTEKKTDGTPVKRLGITQAVVIRVLIEDPSMSPLIMPPSLTALYELIQAIDPEFTPRDFGVLMGRSGSAGYRWLRRGSARPMRQEAQRWMTMIWLRLSREDTTTTTGRRKAQKALKDLRDLVVDEAILRGCDPVILAEKYRFVRTDGTEEED